MKKGCSIHIVDSTVHMVYAPRYPPSAWIPHHAARSNGKNSVPTPLDCGIISYHFILFPNEDSSSLLLPPLRPPPLPLSCCSQDSVRLLLYPAHLQIISAPYLFLIPSPALTLDVASTASLMLFSASRKCASVNRAEKKGTKKRDACEGLVVRTTLLSINSSVNIRSTSYWCEYHVGFI